MITAADADTDSSGSLSEEELQALTIAQLREIAAELGYTITAKRKAAIIAEILEAQALAEAEAEAAAQAAAQETTPGEEP